MGYTGPVLLASEHVLTGFDCGKPPLNQWLTERALTNQASGTSRTWVVIDDETARVVGFYASATGSILRSEVTSRLRRNQPEEIPVIILGRLAVDEKHARRGPGSALLKHAMLKAIEVRQSVGVRLMLVHAKDEEAKAFYERYDFMPSPVDDLTLMMVLPEYLF